MSNISAWSTTAANNNSSPPDGFPENQLPSTLNNAARELMAAIRTFYQAAAWIDLGDTPTYASTTTFTVPGDQTAFYTVNRRIRCTDATTLYGYISSSVYVASTTVTVVLDSGSLSASLSAVAVGLLDPAHYPVAAEGIKGTFTGPIVASTGSFSGAVTSTKSAQSGYTRYTPNYCVKDLGWSDTSITADSNVTVSAPNANAKMVRVLFKVAAVAAGSALARYGVITLYPTSGFSGGYAAINAKAYESASTTGGTTLCENEAIVDIPLSATGGDFYITLSGDAGGNEYGFYNIIGYFD